MTLFAWQICEIDHLASAARPAATADTSPARGAGIFALACSTVPLMAYYRTCVAMLGDGAATNTLAAPPASKLTSDGPTDRFLQLPSARAHDTRNPVDRIDGLKRLFTFSKRNSIRWAAHLAQWLTGLRVQPTTSCRHYALGGQHFRKRRALLVYGRTHHSESREAACQHCRPGQAEPGVFQRRFVAACAFRRCWPSTSSLPAT